MPEAAAAEAGPARQNGRKQMVFLAWLLAPAAALLVAVEATRLHVDLCLFHRLTGLPCPGCGMTRGVLALLGGDVRAALAFHPLSPVVVAIVGAWWVNNLLAASGRPRLFRAPAHAGQLAWVGIAVALGLWGLRLAGVLPGPGQDAWRLA